MIFERFGDLLKRVDRYEWYVHGGLYGLFVDNNDEETTADSRCAILFIDDEMPDEEIHPVGKLYNLINVADIDMLKRIVRVARKQRPDCTEDDLVRSYHFYYDHDAFLLFDYLDDSSES